MRKSNLVSNEIRASRMCRYSIRWKILRFRKIISTQQMLVQISSLSETTRSDRKTNKLKDILQKSSIGKTSRDSNLFAKLPVFISNVFYSVPPILPISARVVCSSHILLVKKKKNSDCKLTGLM